jgi:transposase
VDPQAYLADVLTRLAGHPHAQLDDLLPHRWQPAA